MVPFEFLKAPEIKYMYHSLSALLQRQLISLGIINTANHEPDHRSSLENARFGAVVVKPLMVGGRRAGCGITTRQLLPSIFLPCCSSAGDSVDCTSGCYEVP